MKFYLFAFFIFSISFNAISQSTEYSSCEEAEQYAIAEAKKVFYTQPLVGMDDDNIDWEFINFAKIYLYSKHNIKSIPLTDIGLHHDDCYYAKHKEIFNKKFKNNFTKKLIDSLKLAYPKLSRQEKAQFIDSNKVYQDEYLDSRPKFIGNDYDIKVTLKKMVLNTNQEFISCTLIIARNGQIIDMSLDESTFLKPEISKTIAIEQFSKLGQFVPAYIYDKKVKAEIFVIF